MDVSFNPAGPGAGIGSASDRCVQVGVWNIQGLRRAEQHRIRDGIGGPLAVQSRKLQTHDIGHQFVAQRGSFTSKAMLTVPERPTDSSTPVTRALRVDGGTITFIPSWPTMNQFV